MSDKRKLSNMPTQFQLSSLNGENGFTLSSNNNGDDFGISVDGNFDFNGDNISDIIVGASNSPGAAYILFGSASPFSATINPQAINATTGSVIYGLSSQDQFGCSVSSAGDFNADGIDDVVIGAYKAMSNGVGNVGAAYVVFGSKNVTSHMSVGELNGQNGFMIGGMKPSDQFGWSVGGAINGDFNGDGIADIVIGAPGANTAAGQVYVVFGSKDPFEKMIMAKNLNGKNGFVIDAMEFNYNAGKYISLAGDYNADGLKDILIGAPAANGGSGISYAVWGTKQPPALFKLNSLNGANGFSIVGNSGNFGSYVNNAGDINHDGISDMVFTTKGMNNGDNALVVYGSKNVFPTTTNFITGSALNIPSFLVYASCASVDFRDVNGVGDVNDDGIDDLQIGAINWVYCCGNYDYNTVVFGNSTRYNNDVDLCNYVEGITLVPTNNDANLGWSVAFAGDINNDGIADWITGAPCNNCQSQAHVVFGSMFFGGAETEVAGNNTEAI